MKPSFLMCLPLVLVFADAAAAQRPGSSSTKASALSATEIRAIHSAFQGALRTPAVRDAVRASVLAQLRATRPIAFANGQWVVPIDVAAIYRTPTVQAAITTELAGNMAGPRLNQISSFGIVDRLGFAFVPNQLGDQLIGVAIGRIRNSLAPAVFLQNTTDVLPTDEIKLMIDGAAALANMTSTLIGLADAFGHWWTSSGTKDPNTGLELDDPNADPDGDGVPNRLDGDDDGDGAPDKDDQAPYDPGTQICHDCGHPATAAVFTRTSASAVLQVTLTAQAAVQKMSSNRLLSLGAAARIRAQQVPLLIGFGSNP